MQNKKKNQNELNIDTAQIVSYCPLCNTSFKPHEAMVIGTEGSMQLLYVTCSHCTSSIVMLLLMNETGVSSVGLVTDLSQQEISQFRNSQLISCNDVIEIHESLHSGSDFLCLL